ncbi:MAG: hypothetical protein KJZ93_00785 [Caldilineaceae bacterium]|nr:hypothetical protein [Caldilineaceae bacterium]
MWTTTTRNPFSLFQLFLALFLMAADAPAQPRNTVQDRDCQNQKIGSLRRH